ncbi:MAG TPA: patatin-like phospholipase family protein [Ottowia sp.]|uniref:patatin-like phospholipase family protein n=1 Tax=Ottowia sp. TaxID=1898956 RepID=UPI002BEAFEC1|nr:patatin-like phospholipase family protein [Ottowia sp.]HMN19892.1 patatin-like phospholipase family protein [Ottowia sp.]
MPAPRPLNLALQGGGGHGAFTWGVLDALLEDGRFELDGLCGTSSGAMNAVALAQGLATARTEGADEAQARQAARQSLRRFWTEIGAMGSFIAGVPLGGGNPWLGLMSQWVSPYQANPFDFNPLRRLLERQIDFELLRRQPFVRLFVNATRVRTGSAEVFTGERISVDAVMASACLPTSFKAVEIDGEHYWDGGYCGNPPIHPLIYRTETRDVLIVQIAPSTVATLPKDASGIAERVADITFNAGLLAELRVIKFVHQMLEDGRFPRGLHKDVLLHHIDGGDALVGFGPASKVRFDGRFVSRLFELGRAAGLRWLAEQAHAVGERSSMDLSLDLDQRYQPPPRSRRRRA